MATLEVRSLATPPGLGVATVHDVSFTVEDGQVAALLLAEDTSAEHLLRTISGLEAPDAGDVLLGGISVLGLPPHRRGIGLVFEDPALFPDRDAWDNVGFGLRMGGWPKAGREARVAELLDLVELADRGGARVDSLTPSERRRLALARALAPDPSALLLEEPLGGLEEAQRAQTRSRLVRLLDREHVTTVIATRSLGDAVALADTLVVLAHGRVLQTGPLADVLARPATAEVARLAGYQVLADGPIEDGHVIETGAGGIELPQESDFAGSAAVMAHPTTVLAVPAGSGLGCGVRGFVRRSRPEGPAALLDVDLGARMVEARWEWDLLPPPLGTSVEIAVRPGTMRFFGTPRSVGEPPREQRSADPATSLPEETVAEGAVASGPAPREPVTAERERNANGSRGAGREAGQVGTRTVRERIMDPLFTKNGNGSGFARPPFRETFPPPTGGSIAAAAGASPGATASAAGAAAAATPGAPTSGAGSVADAPDGAASAVAARPAGRRRVAAWGTDDEDARPSAPAPQPSSRQPTAPAAEPLARHADMPSFD